MTGEQLQQRYRNAFNDVNNLDVGAWEDISTEEQKAWNRLASDLIPNNHTDEA